MNLKMKKKNTSVKLKKETLVKSTKTAATKVVLLDLC